MRPDDGVPDDAIPDDDTPDIGPAPVVDRRADFQSSGACHLVVIGDADLVSDAWWPQQNWPELMWELFLRNGGRHELGTNLLANASAWLTGSDELLGLRARSDKARTLETIDRDKQKFLKWVNILGVPLFVFLVGVVVWLVRRR